MLGGVVLLWFIEVALAVAWVAWDIRQTPEAAVLKWGFVVVTGFSGLFGALLYALACREPLPGTHQPYVSPRWRQVVGSTMHCVAGDGIGILVTAAALAPLHLPTMVDLGAEYAVGFGFGWTIFQALFMRGMLGGSYGLALRHTFLPELLSMNGVMAAMAAVSTPWQGALAAAASPSSPDFWFVMSLALCAGFLVAYPINWWLVASGLKHGMTTVLPDGRGAPLAAASLWLAPLWPSTATEATRGDPTSPWPGRPPREQRSGSEPPQLRLPATITRSPAGGRSCRGWSWRASPSWPQVCWWRAWRATCSGSDGRSRLGPLATWIRWVECPSAPAGGPAAGAVP